MSRYLVNSSIAMATAALSLALMGAPASASDKGYWSTGCAGEGDVCLIGGPFKIRYGARGVYVYGRNKGGFVCNAKTFGRDPLPGVAKQCDFFCPPGQC